MTGIESWNKTQELFNSQLNTNKDFSNVSVWHKQSLSINNQNKEFSAIVDKKPSFVSWDLSYNAKIAEISKQRTYGSWNGALI